MSVIFLQTVFENASGGGEERRQVLALADQDAVNVRTWGAAVLRPYKMAT